MSSSVPKTSSAALATARPRWRRSAGLVVRKEMVLATGTTIWVATAQMASNTPIAKNLLAMKRMITNMMKMR